MTYKEQLRKVEENVYELPKMGEALVPGRIFFSERMIKTIEEDALKQVANVAHLLGIIKYSIGLPDMHVGYGFPIGGVAAFDLDKGIISPGGVGYDINCLTGDSRILTEFGTYKEIKDFEDEIISIEEKGLELEQIQRRLISLNLKNRQIESKEILFFMKKKEKVYEIETDIGFKIKASLNHPFLTKGGMKKLESLKKEQIAILPFEGIKENQEINKKLAIIAKIFGYILGDGTVYFSNKKGYVSVYGKKEDLERMKEDLERIGFKSSIYYRERKGQVNNHYKINGFLSKCYELHTSSLFANLLKESGMPIGNKSKQEFSVPSWIKSSPKYIKRLFLAGFFGAELSSPKTHTKTGFYCPILNQNKIKRLKQDMRRFMLEISEMLSEFKININKITEINYPSVSTVRLIISAEENNLLKLWRNIGFEYNNDRQKLADIASLYILKKKAINKNRKEVAKKIKEYKKRGFKLKELKEIFNSHRINKRFIERHYYENAGQRLNLDFISFNEFKENCLKDLKDYGCLFDDISKISNLKEEEVYDFTIADNHNFIANNFIVSNCGVRILKTNLTKKDIQGKEKIIVEKLYNKIPSGLGRGSRFNINRKELNEVLKKGSQYIIEKGYGIKEDYLHTEEEGCIENGNPENVSERAVKRGIGQLGTLGAGNHFLEVQRVDDIYDNKIAKVFGLEKEQITIMIHCGSRGLGHQVASDYIKLMEKEYGFANLPDRELINAPIKSKLGKEYYSAMNCAANFAFANRQLITFWVREAMKEIFPEIKVDVVYDVCHNIAKIEEHIINGKKKKVCVHRKGATRSFGIGRKEIPKDYRKVGQPVLIPGSMGTASYILVGTKKAEELTFGSTAHGAGRVKSRISAIKNIKVEDVKKDLNSKNIEVKAGSWASLAEEAPEAYKDIDEVVDVVDSVGLSKKIARLKPMIVIKG